MRAFLATSSLLGLLLAGSALAQPAPAPAPRGAEARKAELDKLFQALASAPDEASAGLLDARIRALWTQAASPAVTLLMRRGTRNMETEAFDEAAEDFQAAAILQEDYADAQVLLGQALSRLGETREAALALQRALVLEPRHYGALLTLSAMQEEANDFPGALKSLEAALAIYPKMPNAEKRLRDLTRKAVGEAM